MVDTAFFLSMQYSVHYERAKSSLTLVHYSTSSNGRILYNMLLVLQQRTDCTSSGCFSISFPYDYYQETPHTLVGRLPLQGRPDHTSFDKNPGLA